MRRWQAVVFDLDDTLYPERLFVLSGLRAVALWGEAHLGLPADRSFAELKQLFEEGVRGDTFNRWSSAHQLSPEQLVPTLVEVYREHLPTLSPLPGVPKLLADLRQSYRLGLVSDGFLGVQRRKLAALGVIQYFDAVVFSDEFGREAWKPSTKPFEAVLQRLDVVPDAAVYIADNVTKDFIGARQLGMFTIRFKYGEGEYTHVAPATPLHNSHQTIDTLSELWTLLLEQEN